MSPTQVLIVDDNEELADNLCEILDAIDGFEVRCHVTTDAEAALATATRQDLDLAVVDLHLPDASGFELLEDLRQHSPFVQVIIVTGDATVESAISAVRRGAFAYVLKPFRGSELLDTAERALRQSSLERERDQLRRALEASEQRHRQVVDNVPAFVAALDRDGAILVWNRHLEQVTGFTRDEMLGKSGLEFVSVEGGDRRLPLKGGGHRLVRWHATKVSDGHPGEVDTYAMGIDVTAETEQLQDRLRTERLAAVGTLAAGLAHEVRNPLNSAMLQLQVLERRIDKGETSPERLKTVTTLVRDEVQRLDRLVNEFLDFARPQKFQMDPTDLTELIQATVELVRPEAEATGVSISLALDSHLAPVPLDRLRFHQVLLNLLRNALEAMSGGGVLKVRTDPVDDAGYVAVEVEDTGTGFDTSAPIFDAFFTTKDSGTGLGLAIVYRIVAEHGGTITAESDPGRTCFRIRLPQPSAGTAPATAAQNLRQRSE